MIAWTVNNTSQVEPDQHLLYHLQEAGATPVQEVGLRAGTAIAVLDAVRDAGRSTERMGDVVARISFFVNAGVRFVEEMASCARSASCGTRSATSATASRTQARRFRYGVQVNSLGLTEAQPENNVQRIVLETLA